MFDVVALGETLIDFTPSGVNEQGMQLFSCNPGGAPANVLAMNTRLGGKTAFIGMVGKDDFGRFLRNTMLEAGIDISGLRQSEDIPTTLAFVQLDKTGNRSFSFYRKPGADICLESKDLNRELLTDCHLFHFGSVSLTDEPSRSTTIEAAREAKRAGAIISFDPNYRAPLWKDEEEAIRIIKQALPLADIIKISDEEMSLLTGDVNTSVAGQMLLQYGARLVLVTGGEKGAYFCTRKVSGSVPAFNVDVIDTTGSGDAFVGAFLYKIRNYTLADIEELSAEELKEIVSYANAAGGLTAEKRGAIPAMPDESMIDDCIKNTRQLLEVCFSV